MKKDELKEYLNKDIESLRSLNFSETYIKSVVENTSKWAGTGLLGGIDDPHVGRNVATLMENQILLNKQLPEHESQWKRTSIPSVRRIFGQDFPGYDLVSVQCMKSSQEATHLVGFDGRTVAGLTEAHTRALPISWEPPIWKENGETRSLEFRGQSYVNAIDAEAESTALFSEAVRNDFTREIIRDLALNAGKLAVYEYKNELHLLSLVEGMSAYIAAKCFNREATWIVTSPAIVKLLREYIEPATRWGNIVDIDQQRDGVNKIGLLDKKWQIFEDSSAPSGNILLGLKDHRNHYFSGYVFAPYLPVNVTSENRQVLARYGKRLTNPGFYGTIKIEKLPEVTPLETPEETESEE